MNIQDFIGDFDIQSYDKSWIKIAFIMIDEWKYFKLKEFLSILIKMIDFDSYGLRFP